MILTFDPNRPRAERPENDTVPEPPQSPPPGPRASADDEAIASLGVVARIHVARIARAYAEKDASAPTTYARERDSLSYALCRITADTMSRPEQVALGMLLVREATKKGPRSHWGEYTGAPDDDRRARVEAAVEQLQALPGDVLRHAVNFITGIAQHSESADALRLAFREYINERLGLDDLTYVVNRCSSMLERWARAAGAERPTFPKPGRPRKQDTSTTNGGAE